MRTFYTLLFAAALVGALCPAARADEIDFRGNYWRDRNTRVVQPEASIQKELPTGTVVGAHYLLDAITSASVAAGVSLDATFTELRNEVGFNVGQKFKDAFIGASYTYSGESDYWSHTAALTSSLDLNQKNTTLALTVAYGHDTLGLRVGPTLYNVLGSLDKVQFIATWTQILSRHALLNFSSDTAINGFGSASNGSQENAYRNVIVGGTPTREKVPYQRIRQAFTLALYLIFPTHNRITPNISLRPSYRIYFDDWGLVAHTPDLRLYIPVGPTEFRPGVRYYTQSAASFFSEVNDAPSYTSGGKACTTCLLAKSKSDTFYTADPKLSAMSSVFIDLRFLVHLRGLKKATWLPAHNFFGDGAIELMYGHYFNTRLAYTTFGDADLASIDFAFPL